jgi:hypothetical protein
MSTWASAGAVEHVLRPIGAPTSVLRSRPTERLITGSWSGIVERWNATSGTPIGQPLLAAAAPVASISFGRDPDMFATAGLSDGLVKLWTTSPLEQFGASFPGSPGALVHAALAGPGSDCRLRRRNRRRVAKTLSVWKTHACTVAGDEANPRRMAPFRARPSRREDVLQGESGWRESRIMARKSRGTARRRRRGRRRPRPSCAALPSP